VIDPVHQTPAGNRQIPRGRTERTATTTGTGRRTRTHCDPPVAGWQPGRRPRARAPPRSGTRSRGSPGFRRRQQRAVAARTPRALLVADIPACAALGAHLDHSIRLTGRSKSAASGEGRPVRWFRGRRRRRSLDGPLRPTPAFRR
jgi:hypothetical protein